MNQNYQKMLINKKVAKINKALKTKSKIKNYTKQDLSFCLKIKNKYHKLRFSRKLRKLQIKRQKKNYKIYYLKQKDFQVVITKMKIYLEFWIYLKKN